jgi:hypothetical protein
MWFVLKGKINFQCSLRLRRLMKKKEFKLPRVPLTQQTGGAHKPKKGRGVTNRRDVKVQLRKFQEEK